MSSDFSMDGILRELNRAQFEHLTSISAPLLSESGSRHSDREGRPVAGPDLLAATLAFDICR